MLSLHPQTDDSLTEALPASVLNASRRNGILLVVVVALSGFAIELCITLGVSGQLSFSESLIAWPFLAVSGFFVVSLMHRNLKTHAPTVGLHSDMIAVRYGKYTLEAKVKECRIRQGRAGGMRLAGGVVLWSWLPVVLIDLPPFWMKRLGMRRHPRRINTVAVGYTAETREAWECALLRVLNQRDDFSNQNRV